MARNQGSRRSMEAIAAAPSALIDCSSRATVASRTRPVPATGGRGRGPSGREASCAELPAGVPDPAAAARGWFRWPGR